MDVLRALLERLSWRLALYWGALALLLWGLAQLTDEVYEGEGFFFDAPVLGWFYARVSSPATEVMRALSVVGDVPAMSVLAVVTALVLWRVSRREARFFALAVGGAALFMALAKLVLNRPRPELFDVGLWETASASFPSGHATGSMAYALSLYLVVSRLAPRWRGVVGLVGVLGVGLISASRLYLQVHYPSDILAGLALAALWVSGVDALFRYWARDRSRRTVLLRLSGEVLGRLEADAARRGVSLEEMADEVLRERYALSQAAPQKATSQKATR